MLRQFVDRRALLPAPTDRETWADPVRRSVARRGARLARLALAPFAALAAAVAALVYVVLLPICGIASIAEAVATAAWGMLRGVVAGGRRTPPAQS